MLGTGNSRLNGKKLLKYAVILAVVGFIGLIITIVIVVLVIRWAWNDGNSVVQQNPTVSSMVENTKKEVSERLPTVPSNANDFIVNNQVDTTKLSETYNGLPTQTQQVWKNAMEASINDSIKSATGNELNTFQKLLEAVRGL